MSVKNDVFSSGDVARVLGVPRWKLMYWVERGELPGPSLEVRGRRLFTATDLAAIEKVYQERQTEREVAMAE